MIQASCIAGVILFVLLFGLVLSLDWDNLPKLLVGASGQSTFRLHGKYKEAADTFAKYKCLEAIQPCIESLSKEPPPTCSELTKAAQCAFKSCPAIAGQQDEEPTAKLLIEYAQEAHGCVVDEDELLDRKKLPDVTLVRSTFKIMEAAKTFDKYKCEEAIQPCLEPLSEETSPSCKEIIEESQCLLKNCPAISGKEDETLLAKLLMKFAEETHGCVVTTSELLGKGNHAPLGWHRHGVVLSAIVLISSLVPIVIV